MRWLLVFVLVAVSVGVPATGTGAADATRLAGDDRAGTAAAVARALDPPPRSVFLVGWEGQLDALAAGPLAASEEGALLIAGHDRLPAVTEEVLRDLSPQEVTIVGGESRVGPAVVRRVRELTGREPRRLAGPDRFATAAAVARAADGSVPEVWVASGVQPVDALSAGAAAAHAGGAVLLTMPDRLPVATREALRDLAPARIRVAGGSAVVSEGVVEELREFAPTSRVAGADRYATAAEVARAAFGSADRALVATGRGLVDALAAAPLSAQVEAPVLLVPRRCLPDPAVAVMDDLGVDGVTVLGGEAVVAPRVESGATCAEEIVPIRDPSTELATSWREGCPVDPSDLRTVTVDHWTFEGGVRTGLLVVHRDHAPAVRDLFDRLFDLRFPMERVTSVEDYDGDDDAAMAANATTAFNCREVEGRPGVWSQHSYGWAIDINPVQNPWVRGGEVEPPAGREYTDRTDVRPGMVVDGDAIVRAFGAIGWGWGGHWDNSKDYQHFSATGR